MTAGVSTAPAAEPDIAYRNSATSAAGDAMSPFARNLSFILTPCVLVAAMVVSEIIDRLSPNIAPPTTAPMRSAGLSCSGPAKPSAIGVTAAIVPHDVPIASEMRHETRNTPATISFAGTSDCAIVTAASTAPDPFAIVANAPARMKMRHMIMMFGSPIPRAYTSTFSSSVRRRPMMSDTADATRNATGIDTLYHGISKPRWSA